MRIGELAARCGVSVDTVRFYERRGLLPRPTRSAAGYRLYGENDESRLRFVRQAQANGLTLSDIRELLRQGESGAPDECQRVAALLRERIASVEHKLAELEAFRCELVRSLERCEAAGSAACPVILDLAGRAKQPRRERRA